MTIISPTAPHSASLSSLYHMALQAVTFGIGIVPIRTDGSKQPCLVSWREYQHRRASEAELRRWFGTASLGVAFITGAVSENLEALDFDCRDTFDAWLRRLQRDPTLCALYEHLSWGYLEATPSGGRHLLYRCDVIEGNRKLAMGLDGEKRKTLIETRGEGGFIIVAPSRGGVHPSGRPYVLLRGGASSIRTITASQRSLLFASTQAFDETPPAHWQSLSTRRPLRSSPDDDGQRPGDLFNQRASWEDILVPHGWQFVCYTGAEGRWRRPDKHDPGISATTNHNGHDLLYVFSTSTIFEAERGYSKFHAYTLLNHHGDFSAAARELASQSQRKTA